MSNTKFELSVNLSVKDLITMLFNIKKTIGKDRFIFHPAGWGAARDFDFLEELIRVYNIKLNYVRYDLTESDDLWYGARKITSNPGKIRERLENGITRLCTKSGLKYPQLEERVDFSSPKKYVIFDDWTNSGLSLAGGIFFIAYHADILNPESIYGCTINDMAGAAYFSAYKGYEKNGKPYSGSIKFLESIEPAYNLLKDSGRLHLIKDMPENNVANTMPDELYSTLPDSVNRVVTISRPKIGELV